jgi:hypothetical protein
MTSGHKMTFRQDCTVWVWDSTWLPAVVVQHVPMGCALVRLDHGVTFSVTMADLAPRDPACRGGDVPQQVHVTRSQLDRNRLLLFSFLDSADRIETPFTPNKDSKITTSNLNRLRFATVQ